MQILELAQRLTQECKGYKMYKLTNTTLIIRLADNAFIPADFLNTDFQAYQEWLNAGNIPQPVDAETVEQAQARITQQVQKRLDDFAKTRNYDNCLSACSYVASTNDKFKNEALYCIESRDQTWLTCAEIINDALAGNRPMPDDISDFESELPVLTWP